MGRFAVVLPNSSSGTAPSSSSNDRASLRACRWCVRVDCRQGSSCYKKVSAWAWVSVLGIFLFPALLCMCCLCCLSSKANDLCDLLYRKLFKCEWARSLGRSGRTSPQPNGRHRAAREVELSITGGAAAAAPPRAPSPPPRVNFIKISTLESTLGRLEAEFEGFQAVLGDEPTCAICLGDLDRSEVVKRLACGHVFHAPCVDLWGETATTCPLCKRDYVGCARAIQPQTSSAALSLVRGGSASFAAWRRSRSGGGGGGGGGEARNQAVSAIVDHLPPSTAAAASPPSSAIAAEEAHRSGRSSLDSSPAEATGERMDGGMGEMGGGSFESNQSDEGLVGGSRELRGTLGA